LVYTLLKVGLEDPKEKVYTKKRIRTRILPSNIFAALRIFKANSLMTEIMGKDAKTRYIDLKEKTANRSNKELGKFIKKSEVIYHHEVTNQHLWHQF